MLPIMDSVQHEEEVLSVLKELDTVALQAVTLASRTEDPTVGYHAAQDLIEMAFDEMQCPLIAGIMETQLFNILQKRVQEMMRELDGLRNGGDRGCPTEG